MQPMQNSSQDSAYHGPLIFMSIPMISISLSDTNNTLCIIYLHDPQAAKVHKAKNLQWFHPLDVGSMFCRNDKKGS